MQDSRRRSPTCSPDFSLLTAGSSSRLKTNMKRTIGAHSPSESLRKAAKREFGAHSPSESPRKASKREFLPRGSLLQAALSPDVAVTRKLLVQSASAWGLRQEDKQHPGTASDVIWNGSKGTIYCRCSEHDGCRARYRISLEPGSAGDVGFKGHSIGRCHSSVPALVRRHNH